MTEPQRLLRSGRRETDRTIDGHSPHVAEAELAPCDDGRPEIVEGTTHWLHLERPEIVDGRISAFMAGQG